MIAESADSKVSAHNITNEIERSTKMFNKPKILQTPVRPSESVSFVQSSVIKNEAKTEFLSSGSIFRVYESDMGVVMKPGAFAVKSRNIKDTIATT